MAEEKKPSKFEELLKRFALSYKEDGNNNGNGIEKDGVLQKGKDNANQKRREGVRASSRPKQPTKRYVSPGDSIKRPSVLARPRVRASVLTYSPGSKRPSKAKQGPAPRQRTPTRPPVQRRKHCRRISSTPQSSGGSPSENDENQIMISPIPEVVPTIQNQVEPSYVRRARPVPASMRSGVINLSKVGSYMNDISHVPARNQFVQPRPPPPRPVKTRRDAEGFLAPTSVDPVEALAEREWCSYQAALDEFLAEPTMNVFDKIAYMKQLQERLLSAAAGTRGPPPSVAGSVLGYEPPVSNHPYANWYTNAWMQQSSISNARPRTASIYQRPVLQMAASMRDVTSNSRYMPHFYH